LAPHGLKSSGHTVSSYPRDNLTPATRGILDALAANPATANIGVKSGYRDPAKNAKAGGAKKSQHMKGNAIDLDISGLPASTKKEALDTAIAAGAKGIGVYASGNSLHVDPRANPTVWGQLQNAYKGLTKAQFGMLPDWARPSIDALFGGFNAKPNPNLPDTMQAPQSLAQVRAQDAVAQAFRDPMRALDTIQSRPAINMPARPQTLNPPQRLAPAPVGKVTRTSLPSIPASLPAAPVGKVERAPLGPVGQFSQPARSLQHPTSVAKPTNLAAAPVGKVTKGPALAPATPNASTLAAQYGQYRPSTATSMPTVATPPSVPVGALPAAKPSTATLAAQYAQYRPGTVPPAPVAPVTPPALALPPAQVLAPLLAPPKVVKDYPVAEVQQAPAPPRATAYDVYSGIADTALDNTGLNTVSAMPGGGTSVTNQYGATTGMKNGYQTAVGSLPGITGPTASKFGSAVKGAIPGVAGSALGGLLGGPVGALLGAALAKAVTQPGGLLSKQNSFQTDYFGTLNAAKAKGGLGFPGAPSGGYGTGGKMGASFSNNSANGMRGISPAAADAIGRGVGGLY
jgi:hypothetical protein